MSIQKEPWQVKTKEAELFQAILLVSGSFMMEQIWGNLDVMKMIAAQEKVYHIGISMNHI